MKKSIMITAGVLISSFLAIGVAFADSAAPGSKDDPVVTKSYVDQSLGQIKNYVDSMLSNGGQGGGSELEVVNLNPNEAVILGAGAEIILRAGDAVIYSPTPNGLSDVTGGKDLENGAKVPSNHLLIAPRSDGRGVRAKTVSVFMVRGQYTK